MEGSSMCNDFIVANEGEKLIGNLREFRMSSEKTFAKSMDRVCSRINIALWVDVRVKCITGEKAIDYLNG